MAIPTNIQREHIFQAMIKINRDGIPARRKAKEWVCLYEEVRYPCKLLISWANLYANGKDLNPSPKIFTTYMAQDYLRKLKFKTGSL